MSFIRCCSSWGSVLFLLTLSQPGGSRAFLFGSSLVSALPGVVVVPLRKQYVPVMQGNTTVTHKTAYFGSIFVGAPKAQSFTVVFDTGSGHFFLPSSTCQERTCQRHRQYHRGLSATAIDIDHDGTVVDTRASLRDKVAIEFGTGEIEGEFVRELVCLKEHMGQANFEGQNDCVMVRLITATQMTDEPFEAFVFDGVIGLGLEGLAVHPEFSFFGQMNRLGHLKEMRFGVFLSADDTTSSEISFGGHDPRRMATQDVHWTLVAHPEVGYWQVAIKRVVIGGESYAPCEAGGCSAIVDTGTSVLGVPRQDLMDLHWLLARKVKEEQGDLNCCNFPGPEVIFDLGDGLELKLGPEDYSRPKPLHIDNSKTHQSQVVCRASLLPVDMGEPLGTKVWILGEPMLRKYYTIFDWRERKIGFAPSLQPKTEERSRGPHFLQQQVFEAPPSQKKSDGPSIVQV